MIDTRVLSLAERLRLREQAIALRNSDYLIREIAEKLNASATTIDGWFQGDDPRKLNFWSEEEVAWLRTNYARSTTSDAAKALGRSYRALAIKASKLGIVGRRSFAVIPRLVDSQLAYVLGVLCGDGSCGKDVKLDDTDRTFVEMFAKALELSFQRPVNIRLRNNKTVRFAGKREWVGTQYSAGTEQKEIVKYIKSLGSYRTHEWKIPECVKSGSSDVQCAFLRGLYDSEGSVHTYTKQGKEYVSVELATVNPETWNLKSLLMPMRIRSYALKSRDLYRISIHDALSLIRFNQYVGFTNRKKREKLQVRLRIPQTGPYAQEARELVEQEYLIRPEDGHWFLGPRAIQNHDAGEAVHA